MEGQGIKCSTMKSYLLGILLLLSLNLPARCFGSTATPAGPSAISANSLDGLHLEILFDALLDPASATNTAVYAVQAGDVQNPIVSARLKPDGRTVLLKMDQRVFAGTVTVLVNGLRGSDGQPAYGSYPFIQ